jgi:AcrR family transcriptional regulator
MGAARDLLLEHGPTAVTHQRVAQQAGVGRATVYRHWPRAEQLLLDVMAEAGLPFFRDPRSPVRAWFRRQLRELADELAMPEVAAVALTLMQGAVWDRQIARQRDQFIRTVTERIAAALVLAAEEGELDPAPDPHDTAAMLVGPILYRTALQAGAVPDGFIDQLIDGAFGRGR